MTREQANRIDKLVTDYGQTTAYAVFMRATKSPGWQRAVQESRAAKEKLFKVLMEVTK